MYTLIIVELKLHDHFNIEFDRNVLILGGMWKVHSSV